MVIDLIKVKINNTEISLNHYLLPIPSSYRSLVNYRHILSLGITTSFASTISSLFTNTIDLVASTLNSSIENFNEKFALKGFDVDFNFEIFIKNKFFFVFSKNLKLIKTCKLFAIENYQSKIYVIYPQRLKKLFVHFSEKTNLLFRSENNTEFSARKILQTTTI